jgi:hypothetical protein
MKALRFVLCLFVCLSCVSKTQENRTLNKDNDSNLIEDYSTVMRYMFENDTIKQTVELSLHTENEIHFKIISYNKIKMQDEKLTGIAIAKGGDIELDEDLEGNAYPVYEYIYENDCWIAFRIDKDSKVKMRVIEADCIFLNPCCPFASVNLLLKQ